MRRICEPRQAARVITYLSCSWAILLSISTGATAQTASAREPVAWTTNWFYNDAKYNFLAAAELMPEEHYGFKPVPDVRTFGEIVGHIANWQYTNCSAAAGAPNPNKTDLEKTTEKVAIVAGLKGAYAYCDDVFKKLDLPRLTETGRNPPVMFRAMSAISHPYLHYGNLITYLRLKGIVPPSTARLRQ